MQTTNQTQSWRRRQTSNLGQGAAAERHPISSSAHSALTHQEMQDKEDVVTELMWKCRHGNTFAEKVVTQPTLNSRDILMTSSGCSTTSPEGIKHDQRWPNLADDYNLEENPADRLRPLNLPSCMLPWRQLIWFLVFTSTSSSFYHSHVVVRRLYRHLPIKTTSSASTS